MRRVALVLAAVVGFAAGPSPDDWLGAAEQVAPGIALYRVADQSLIDPPGPVAVRLLKLEPRRVSLRSVLAQEPGIGLARVQDIAARHGAVAAVNAGYFEANGEPSGVLKVGGELVGDAVRQRGAVGIRRHDAAAPVRLLFDRLSVTVSIRFRARGATHRFPVSGLNTVAQPGRLVLHTPRYGPEALVPEGSTSWVLDGRSRVVTSRPVGARIPIPADGLVLSYGGPDVPGALQPLEPGVRVEVLEDYRTWFGTRPAEWRAAPEIVGGAGLLVTRGRAVTGWSVERFGTRFDVERHPRTVVGTGRDGSIWLITVDGRQPEIGLGMTFREVQGLARRLRLDSALNLDGGGSTTMVVRGRIVNHPSDAAGPRPVSDALLVFERR